MKLVSLGRILRSVLIILSVLLMRHDSARAEPSDSARPDLTGAVQTRGGSPLGDATVLIYTAGPRVGPGIFCPSCYLDCGKKARTGADGKFKIESLDPDLLFQILVVERNCRAAVLAKIDPKSGPVEVTLEPRDTSSLGPKNRLGGRVVDPEGKPIPGAVVSFEMFFGDEANCAGRCDGVDPMAVTDDSGEFLLASKKRFDWMTVTVEAPAYARRRFFELPTGRTNEMKLTSGVTITGRVLKDGKPLAGVGVGLKSVDSSENGVGNFSIATSPDGRFNFVNIPPYKDFYLYGLMDSIKPYGSLRSSQVRVKGDGGKKDVGDLLVGPGLRLDGQVVLSDGQWLPPGTQLLLTLDKSWESKLLTLGPEGGFSFAGVPQGPVKLHINVPGYRLSSKNSSRALWNGDWLVGRLDRDLEGLRILLEPGKFEPPDANGPSSPAGDSLPDGKPLRGAEPAER